MKIIILITVIESLTVMFAIMYFYYTRSQKIRRDFQMALHCRSEEQTVKAKLQNQKVDQQTLSSIHIPLKERYKE